MRKTLYRSLVITTAAIAAGLLALAAGLRCRPEADPPQPTPMPMYDSFPLPAISSPRILVEKSLHRLTAFDGDKPAKRYRVAVGEGRGDKFSEGDKCTPEGDFYVCSKNPRSKYVLSLGLSYPDVEDAARGLRDGIITQAQHDAIAQAVRQRRQPPWNTPLGGEIMIHGCGAGRDWTLGCVAMEDDDIRELYPAIPVGTVVRIVP